MSKLKFLLAILVVLSFVTVSFGGQSFFFRDDLSPEASDYHWSDTTPWYLINNAGSPAAGGVPTGDDNVILYFNRETVVSSDATCRMLYVGYWGDWGELTLTEGDYSLASTSYLYAGYSGSNNVITQNGGNFSAVGVRLGFNDSGLTYNMNGGKLSATSGVVVGNAGTGGTSVTFNQTGGTVTTNELAIGKANTTGIYNMTGGTINGLNYSGNLHIGATGSVKAELNLGNAVSTGTITGTEDTSLFIRKDNSSLNGWGVIAMGGSSAGRLFNDGTIKADGFGTDRTLDVSQFCRVINSNDNTGTNGYYAVNHGKLLLPGVAVAAGSASYNWGEDVTDTSIDLVNSLSVSFTNASAGMLDVALLAEDRSDVAAHDGLTFLGVWDFANLAFESADITFRYDDALASELGIDEDSLSIYQFDGSEWVALASVVDLTNKHITATTDDFSTFAVGVPEPATLILLGLGASLIRRKRQ